MKKGKLLVVGAAVAVIGVVVWWQANKSTGTCVHESVPTVKPTCNIRHVATGDIATTLPSTPIAPAQTQIQQIITNASWDEATLTACWSQIGRIDQFSFVERKTIVRLTNVALAACMPAPHNGEELLKTIYGLTLTNEADGRIFGILSSITNEAVTDLLFWAVTNFHFASIRLPENDTVQRHWLKSKSIISIRALSNIGTPTVMDRLNKLLRQLQNEGHGIYEPGRVINPAKYPVEAREWLLNYPEPLVRYRMLDGWLHSGRPETPELIDEFCKRLNGFPDDFYLWHGDPDIAASKRYIIKEIKRARANYVRRYQRWMADGQKENFNSGYYYDEMWDAYKKERGLP